MEYSAEKQREYAKRILLARMRLLQKHGFYGLLLMHLQFSLDPDCATAATDGVRMFFGPEFLDTISDEELEFVMMHEILHVALAHCFRGKDLEHERFNIACDIVVNSNIRHENGDDDAAITLAEYGTLMHIAPDGREGYLCTAEEVYHMLPEQKEQGNAGGGSGDDKKGKDGQGSSGSGTSNHKQKNGSSNGNDRQKNSRAGAGGTQKKEQRGQGSSAKGSTAACSADPTASGQAQGAGGAQQWDDHSIWGKMKADSTLKDTWQHRVVDAVEVLSDREEGGCGRGTVPVGAKRMVDALKKPQTDWRQILCEFIQEEICDYSFSPPDRRYSDSPFFLPDFNEKDELLRDVYFFIDTSGSISRKMMTAAFSEIKGAIDQFDGKLSGHLGFFDASIYEPVPFVDEKELLDIAPKGGGGTDFHVVFDFMKTLDTDQPPMCIIILTDGYAPFPKEAEAMGVPVLWIINNEDVTPPWGKIARIEMNAYKD